MPQGAGEEGQQGPAGASPGAAGGPAEQTDGLGDAMAAADATAVVLEKPASAPAAGAAGGAVENGDSEKPPEHEHAVLPEEGDKAASLKPVSYFSLYRWAVAAAVALPVAAFDQRTLWQHRASLNRTWHPAVMLGGTCVEWN